MSPSLSEDQGVPTAGTDLGRAPDALARILDHAPPVVDEALRDQTTLTSRWGHGELHDQLPGMAGHVIITYYGEAQDIVWRTGGRRLASTTRSGSITIIPEGEDGRWDIAGPIGVSHVFLSQARLQACAEQVAGRQAVELLARVGFDDPMAARIMEMLGRDAAAADPSSRLFVEQATDLLCTQLVRGHSSFGALEPPWARRGLADWQVKRVTSYMHDHLDEAVGLDQLAEQAGLSRFHFCTAFKQATGRSPHEALARMRMERARQLLTLRHLPVTEIALSVGYETPSAFAAAFRRLTGSTPTAFRQSLRPKGRIAGPAMKDRGKKGLSAPSAVCAPPRALACETPRPQQGAGRSCRGVAAFVAVRASGLSGEDRTSPQYRDSRRNTRTAAPIWSAYLLFNRRPNGGAGLETKGEGRDPEVGPRGQAPGQERLPGPAGRGGGRARLPYRRRGVPGGDDPHHRLWDPRLHRGDEGSRGRPGRDRGPGAAGRPGA